MLPSRDLQLSHNSTNNASLLSVPVPDNDRRFSAARSRAASFKVFSMRDWSLLRSLCLPVWTSETLPQTNSHNWRCRIRQIVSMIDHDPAKRSSTKISQTALLTGPVTPSFAAIQQNRENQGPEQPDLCSSAQVTTPPNIVVKGIHHGGRFSHASMVKIVPSGARTYPYLTPNFTGKKRDTSPLLFIAVLT